MAKTNPRNGSNFDDFLKEQGMFKVVTSRALKRALSEQQLQSKNLYRTKTGCKNLSESDVSQWSQQSLNETVNAERNCKVKIKK